MASRRPPDPARIPTVTSPAPTAPESSTDAAKGTASRKPRASRAKKSATATTAGATTMIVSATVEISVDVRRGMIAEAAYLRAERRGFTGGSDQEREDWLSAEAEVDALLKAAHGSSAQ